jgi:hypothetical protein
MIYEAFTNGQYKFIVKNQSLIFYLEVAGNQTRQNWQQQSVYNKIISHVSCCQLMAKLLALLCLDELQ